MLRINFKNNNGYAAYRTIRENDKVDINATHVFRERNYKGEYITRARRLTDQGPWAAANYMRAVHKNGGFIEYLGTPTGITSND